MSKVGIKNDAGKARFSLIPPQALLELAQLYTLGAKKYGDRNWENGLDFERVYDAMERHMLAWRMGETHDPEDGQHHLIAVAWNAFALFTLERTKPEFDNLRPKSVAQQYFDEELLRRVQQAAGTIPLDPDPLVPAMPPRKPSDRWTPQQISIVKEALALDDHMSPTEDDMLEFANSGAFAKP